MISVILIGLASIVYALRELSYHGKLPFRGKFFGPKSWFLKYKYPLEKAPDTLYYNWQKIKYKERFPGSASVFVLFTDFLHLAQFLLKVLIIGAVFLYSPWFGWVDAVIMFAVWSLVFWIVYRLLG